MINLLKRDEGQTPRRPLLFLGSLADLKEKAATLVATFWNGLRSHGVAYAAALACRSKNSAWLIRAFTISGLKGLVTRKAGSGRSPVSRRSGKAVMKMTGTAADARISLTASMPELPSANWISASTILGLVLLNMAVAS